MFFFFTFEVGICCHTVAQKLHFGLCGVHFRLDLDGFHASYRAIVMCLILPALSKGKKGRLFIVKIGLGHRAFIQAG